MLCFSLQNSKAIHFQRYIQAIVCRERDFAGSFEIRPLYSLQLLAPEMQAEMSYPTQIPTYSAPTPALPPLFPLGNSDPSLHSTPNVPHANLAMSLRAGRLTCLECLSCLIPHPFTPPPLALPNLPPPDRSVVGNWTGLSWDGSSLFHRA